MVVVAQEADTCRLSMCILVHQVVQSVLTVVLNNAPGRAGFCVVPGLLICHVCPHSWIFWCYGRANRSAMAKASLRVAADKEQVPWRVLGCRS